MTLEPDGDVWGGSRRPSRFVLPVPLRSIPNVLSNIGEGAKKYE